MYESESAGTLLEVQNGAFRSVVKKKEEEKKLFLKIGLADVGGSFHIGALKLGRTVHITALKRPRGA